MSVVLMNVSSGYGCTYLLLVGSFAYLSSCVYVSRGFDSIEVVAGK